MAAREPMPPLWAAAALARRTDPETSHVSAQEAIGLGLVAEAAAGALRGVREHPGATARELEEAAQVPRSTFGRRLSELDPSHVRRGPARRCRVTGRPAATWWPIEVS